MRKPALSFGPYHPSARPMNPPNSAPAIPSAMVTMMPPGSRPGMTNLAIAPTIKPKKIQPSTIIIRHLRAVACKRRDMADGSHPWRQRAFNHDHQPLAISHDVEVLQRPAGIEQHDRLVRLDRTFGDELANRDECR